MRRIRTRAIAMPAAVLVLALFASVAAANRLAVATAEMGDITIADFRFEAGGVDITCRITVSASLHSATNVKTVRALVGQVTHVEVGRCAEGAVTVLTETLPWQVLYNGFTGRLPAPTGVRLLLVGAAYRVSGGGVTCLARTDSSEPSGGTVALDERGVVTGLTLDPTLEIDIDDSGFLCELAGDVSVSGTASAGYPPVNVTLV